MRNLSQVLYQLFLGFIASLLEFIGLCSYIVSQILFILLRIFR